ncbi:hypothetical protein K3M67_10955 [Sphingobium sp. V4]|uniref:hypothetical protein n=1 Tax=Sphingobium sp. V4 TaxID=3038927 RepID=UPI00255813DA|nr:hypothetical protein [Sphingobium sp. V4]WIW87494.1 hypothetical protein K3M67_10955 [Sphingobium sp. V4]
MAERHGLSIAILLAGLAVTALPSHAQSLSNGEQFAPTRPPVSVRYGSAHSQIMNFWRASGRTPAPLVLIIEDGGWPTRQTVSAYKLAATLADSGIAVAAMGTRPRRPVGVRTIVADVNNILQFLASQAERRGIRTDQFAIIGVGSGGAPAALMATEPGWTDGTALAFENLRALILIDAAGLDPELTLRTARPDRRLKILEALGETEEKRTANSAIGHLATPNVPDALLLLSEERRNRRGGTDFSALLNEHGVITEVREMPRTDTSNNRGIFGNPLNPATRGLIEYLAQRLGK